MKVLKSKHPFSINLITCNFNRVCPLLNVRIGNALNNRGSLPLLHLYILVLISNFRFVIFIYLNIWSSTDNLINFSESFLSYLLRVDWFPANRTTSCDRVSFVCENPLVQAIFMAEMPLVAAKYRDVNIATKINETYLAAFRRLRSQCIEEILT